MLIESDQRQTGETCRNELEAAALTAPQRKKVSQSLPLEPFPLLFVTFHHLHLTTTHSASCWTHRLLTYCKAKRKKGVCVEMHVELEYKRGHPAMKHSPEYVNLNQRSSCKTIKQPVALSKFLFFFGNEDIFFFFFKP